MVETSYEFNMSVTPAKAGVQNYLKSLDSRFRGNDIGGVKFFFMLKISSIFISYFNLMIPSSLLRGYLFSLSPRGRGLRRGGI